MDLKGGQTGYLLHIPSGQDSGESLQHAAETDPRNCRDQRDQGWQSTTAGNGVNSRNFCVTGSTMSLLTLFLKQHSLLYFLFLCFFFHSHKTSHPFLKKNLLFFIRLFKFQLN